MTINKNLSGNQLTIALEGRLDTTTAPELESELKMSLDNVNSLIFDLDKLDYISSAGLRVLLSAQKIMSKKGSMKVTQCQFRSFRASEGIVQRRLSSQSRPAKRLFPAPLRIASFLLYLFLRSG